MPLGTQKCVAILIVMALAGCGGGANNTSAAHTASSAPPSSALMNAPAPLVTPTYDGSGQAVHPDVVDFGSPWHGFRYWMSMTPYPDTNAAFENPSILVSNDGLSWAVPPGLQNPVAHGNSDLADPDLLYNSATDELWLTYIQKAGTTHVMRMKSRDGITWSAPESLVASPQYTVLAPSVVKKDAVYYMYSTNAPIEGCSGQTNTLEVRTSTDGVAWSAPKTVAFSQPGFLPWHADMEIVKGEFWALVAAYPAGGPSCGASRLFFARSTDGLNWTTYTDPVLRPSNGWDSANIYRSSFEYDSARGVIRVWYSVSGHSHIGYTERAESQFFSSLTPNP